MGGKIAHKITLILEAFHFGRSLNQMESSRQIDQLMYKQWNNTPFSWRFQVGLEFDNPDIHSQLVNPAFVDSFSHDYRLRSGSPALVAGEGGSPVGAYIREDDVVGYTPN